MLIQVNQPVQVDAKILKLHMKVSDEFVGDLFDSNGNKLREYEGYVPKFMPGEHFGDYLILDIDINTGQILNWKVPTSEQIEEFVNTEL